MGKVNQLSINVLFNCTINSHKIPPKKNSRFTDIGQKGWRVFKPNSNIRLELMKIGDVGSKFHVVIKNPLWYYDNWMSVMSAYNINFYSFPYFKHIHNIQYSSCSWYLNDKKSWLANICWKNKLKGWRMNRNHSSKDCHPIVGW